MVTTYSFRATLNRTFQPFLLLFGWTSPPATSGCVFRIRKCFELLEVSRSGVIWIQRPESNQLFNCYSVSRPTTFATDKNSPVAAAPAM